MCIIMKMSFHFIFIPDDESAYDVFDDDLVEESKYFGFLALEFCPHLICKYWYYN